MLSRTSSNTDNSTELLEREHQSRELQRTKTKLPILLLSALFIALGVGGGVYFINNHQMALGVTIIIVGVFLALCCINTFGLLADWDRAVILRLGRFQRVTGPGIFKKIPVIDSVMRIVDMRIRTTSF